MAQAQAQKQAKDKIDPVFIWHGTNKQGKKIKGERRATTINAAKSILYRQGITSLKVKKKPKDLFAPRKPAVKTSDIVIFSRMVSTMVSSGVPLVQSMQIIGEDHANSSVREMILAIKADMEAGTTFADSLAKFPLHFDELFVSLIDAGEKSGTLETLLNEIAIYKEKTEALKEKIKKALVYPVAILVVAFVVTAILMVFVIPQFEELFEGFDAELPGLTQFVIGISQFFQQWWWLIFGSVIGSVFALRTGLRHSQKVRHIFDRVMLKVPVVGVIQTKGAIARFSRTFSILLKAGVPMIEAMISVAGACGNVVYKEAVIDMRDDISAGTLLALALSTHDDLFPNIVAKMVAIGEESGTLDAMLAKVADFFEAEVDSAVDNMTALMEPIIMSFLGVVIGTLVVAMYLPIFEVGGAV